MLLARLSLHFQSLPPLPASKWHPSSCWPGADSWVGELVYILGFHGPLKQILLRLEVSSAAPTPTGFYSLRLWGFIFSTLEPWVVITHPPVVPPDFYLHTNVGPPSLSAATSHLSSLPQLPLSAPPTGMDECFFLNSSVVGLPYSSIFWQFWVFLYWLLSFFWLCKEVKHIYLHLHLGQKSPKWNYFKYSSVIPVLAFISVFSVQSSIVHVSNHLGVESQWNSNENYSQ